MKIVVYVLVGVIVMVGLVIGCAAPAPAPAPAVKPITLKHITCIPYYPNSPSNKHYTEYIVERVKEQSKGQLIIEMLGGPEVIPAANQIEALRSGVIDIAWIFPDYYKSMVPENTIYSVSEFNPYEGRERGYNDYINKLHKKYGLFYLGRTQEGGYLLYTKKLVKTPYSDFRGQKMGMGGALWVALADKLGIVPVVMAVAEKYTALERGVIDGTSCNAVLATSMRYGEVCKYRIDHLLWQNDGSPIVMNLDSWNKLPKQLQDVLMGEMINMEKSRAPLLEKMIEEDRNGVIKQGCEMIKFSPADAKWYVNIANEANWEVFQKQCPEAYPILRDMLRK